LVKMIDLEKAKTRLAVMSRNRLETKFYAQLFLEYGQSFTKLPRIQRTAIIWEEFEKQARSN